LSRQVALRGSLFAFHVQSNPRRNVTLGANTIHRLLHLAMTAVPSFHGVGRGRKEFVIQESQCFLQVRGEELLQGFANPPEAPHSTP
jgi:hypothetical protein